MCTNFLLQAEDGTFINGRSMEFGDKNIQQSQLVILPKKAEQLAIRPNTQYTINKYNIIGINAGPIPEFDYLLTDGMNDQGLSCGSLWMPGSKYHTTPVSGTESVFAALFNNWALGQCASVEEVKYKLKSKEVVLWENGILQEFDMLPLHFPVMDKSGASIVIEYTNQNKSPNIYDNPVNVTTNAPAFPKQLEHMKAVKYNNGRPLSPYNPATSKRNKGNSFGLVGTPGDLTPPARFSKIGIFKEFATDHSSGYGLKTGKDAKILAYHLLNTVDIPKGVVRYGTPENSKGSDFSCWVVVKDLTNLEIQVRMYQSSIPYSLDFSVFNDNTIKENRAITIPADQLALPLTCVR